MITHVERYYEQIKKHSPITNKEILKKININRLNVSRSIAKLEKLGLITVSKNYSVLTFTVTDLKPTPEMFNKGNAAKVKRYKEHLKIVKDYLDAGISCAQTIVYKTGWKLPTVQKHIRTIRADQTNFNKLLIAKW